MVQDTTLLLITVNFKRSSLAHRIFIGVALNSITVRACPSPQHVDTILCFLSLFQWGRLLLYIQNSLAAGQTDSDCRSHKLTVTVPSAELADQLPLGHQMAQEAQGVTAVLPHSGSKVCTHRLCSILARDHHSRCLIHRMGSRKTIVGHWTILYHNHQLQNVHSVWPTLH